jgi:hypothetical protein
MIQDVRAAEMGEPIPEFSGQTYAISIGWDGHGKEVVHINGKRAVSGRHYLLETPPGKPLNFRLLPAVRELA